MGRGRGKKRKRRRGRESGRGSGRGRKWGTGKRKEKGKEKGKGKRKGRWKKESLRKVGPTDGRTNARTDTQMILYSVQCYCIALDRQKVGGKGSCSFSTDTANFRQGRFRLPKILNLPLYFLKTGFFRPKIDKKVSVKIFPTSKNWGSNCPIFLSGRHSMLYGECTTKLVNWGQWQIHGALLLLTGCIFNQVQFFHKNALSLHKISRTFLRRGLSRHPTLPPLFQKFWICHCLKWK